MAVTPQVTCCPSSNKQFNCGMMNIVYGQTFVWEISPTFDSIQKGKEVLIPPKSFCWSAGSAFLG